MNKEQLQNKIIELRIQWKNEKDDVMRDIIKRRGIALKRSIALLKNGDIVETAKQIFDI